MKRILFVDDERSLLSGLQNLLRKQRHRWDMVFADGGEAALEVMREGSPFDVVISDMRMPGMDGPTFLARVRDEFPRAARIVLSGHAEPDALTRALPVAHQFLSKPCDFSLLCSVIERACDLQELLGDEEIRRVVSRLDMLPSAPNAHHELTQALLRPDVGAHEIAAIVEKDPAMSVKVLQLVNSAYFGLSQTMTSIGQSVAYLGTDLLRGLALSAHTFASVDGKPTAWARWLEEIRTHSLLAARIGRSFTPDPKQGEEVFIACLAHDIGKIVLGLELSDRFREALHVARRERQPLHVIEKDLLGITHAEVGGYLLGVWGLPLSMVQAVAYHHAPGKASADTAAVIARVHVADAIAHATESGPVSNDMGLLDEEFLADTGVLEEIGVWRSLASDELERAVAD